MEKQCPLCAVDNYMYPTGCGNNEHVACITCLKGNAIVRSPTTNIDKLASIKCPYCTRSSARSYYTKLNENPEQIQRHNVSQRIEQISRNDYVWLYQGRNNGWWLFDLELQDLLTEKYEKSLFEFEWSICGQKMSYDFDNMLQTNTHSYSVREIKRITTSELKNYLIKGVSGMK